MDLNIKGIIHLDFRKFKTVEELVEFVENDDNFDNLANICFDERDNTVINYKTLYETIDEIWVLDNYLVAKKEAFSKQIRINPDLGRFLLERSINYVDKRNEEKEKEEKRKNEEFIANLSIDIILDRISKIGFENITEEEKEFLKNNR